MLTVSRATICSRASAQQAFGHRTATGRRAGSWPRRQDEIKKSQKILEPILNVIGARQAPRIHRRRRTTPLSSVAGGYSSAAVTMGHLALKRAIRRAQANDVVSRNVAALAHASRGQE
jgi:hypothetical protein